MSRRGPLPLCGSLALSFVLLQSTLAAPPQTAASSQQAVVLLQKSLAAMVGSASISDVTLTGSARRIAGSDDETGSATLKAAVNGSARLDFSFASGNSSEVSNLFASAPAGSWSGPDNTSHPLAFHNLLAETAWFSPGLAIARRLSPTDLPIGSKFVATYVAHETLNDQAVEHVTVTQTSSIAEPQGGPTLAHLSEVDFYLDSTTLLPAAISFNIHPDNNALLDLPVQVLFSDYRTVSGVQVPFHVEKFFNNVLALDLQFQSASINSGLSAGAFSIQ
jgi:hypothetical protein